MGPFILLTGVTWLVALFFLLLFGPAGVCIVLPGGAFFTVLWYFVCFGEPRRVQYSGHLNDADDDGDINDPFRLDQDGIPKDPITKWWLYNELQEHEKHLSNNDHNPFT